MVSGRIIRCRTRWVSGGIGGVGRKVRGLAPVVPGQEFDEFRLGLESEGLSPGRVPEVVAAPHPVLGGEIRVEPGGDGLHVGFTGEGADVGLVCGRDLGLAWFWPCVPAEEAADTLAF